MSAATDHSTDTSPNPSPPHTPSRTGEPEVLSTPAAATLRPALQNHYAPFTHGISAQAIRMRTNPRLLTQDPFVYRVENNMEQKISRNDGVAKSLKTVGDITRSDLEGKRYPPTILLLNRISKLYFELSGRTEADAAIVFAYTRGSSPPGAWLGDTVQPDYSAFTSKIDYLRNFIRGKNPPAQPWSLLVGVGEHKREDEPYHAQLKTYMSTVKRYRPDLATVHGFHVAGDCVELALLNACCLCLSPEYKVSSLAPWLALVASIYYSVDHRDIKITYDSSQTDFHRWDVRYGAEEDAFAAVPFHAGDAPGRTAFTAFELGPLSTPRTELSEVFYNKPADGFFKMSWQDAAARWHESELLNFLHDKEWLPGLVRPRYVERFDNVVVERQGVLVQVPKPKPKKAGDEQKAAKNGAEQPIEEVKKEGPTKRELEIIHLGSIGEPLSQARTLRHALFAVYDLVETSAHMGELNVLHRDLSWHNCLIFPRHTVQDGKREASRPCIRRILDTVGVTVDSILDDIGRRDPKHPDGPYEPCGLITDLDHSAKIDGLIDGAKAGRRERTGTPLFIACEVAVAGSLRSHSDPVENLIEILELVEQEKGAAVALAAAFPSGDGGFMEMIKRVIPVEHARRKKAGLYGHLAPPNPTPVQEPRHDAESLYWVMLWFFARAKPSNARQTDANRAPYNAFCQTMLTHQLGGEIGEQNRRQYLSAAALREIFLHPAFARAQLLFAHIALYLSIPWYLYADDPYFSTPGGKNHAHVAFRRLLLWMLLRTDLPELDIPLNTEEPRITPVFGKSVKAARKSKHRAATGNDTSVSQVVENVAAQEKPPSPEIAGYKLRGQHGRDRHRKGSSTAPAKSTKRAPSKKHAKSTSHTSTSSRKRARDETDVDSDGDGDDDDDAPARKVRAVLVSGDDTHSVDQDDSDPPAPVAIEQPMELDPNAPTDSSSSVDQPAASIDQSTASVTADTAADEAKGVKQRPLDPKIQRYVAKIHAGQQTVNALRLKIWKDKTLWFGRGD